MPHSQTPFPLFLHYDQNHEYMCACLISLGREYHVYKDKFHCNKQSTAVERKTEIVIIEVSASEYSVLFSRYKVVFSAGIR